MGKRILKPVSEPGDIDIQELSMEDMQRVQGGTGGIAIPFDVPAAGSFGCVFAALDDFTGVGPSATSERTSGTGSGGSWVSTAWNWWCERVVYPIGDAMGEPERELEANTLHHPQVEG